MTRNKLVANAVEVSGLEYAVMTEVMSQPDTLHLIVKKTNKLMPLFTGICDYSSDLVLLRISIDVWSHLKFCDVFLCRSVRFIRLTVAIVN